MRPGTLERLSSYLSIHIKNIQTESICDLGDNFGAECSWNPNQPFQIVLDLVSLFPYTTSNVVTWYNRREHLDLVPNPGVS
jgi:hypothetical protein